jgi:hypothetical protein
MANRLMTKGRIVLVPFPFDDSTLAIRLSRLEMLLKRTLVYLSGRRRPVDPKEFRFAPKVRELWELPPEVRNQSATQGRRAAASADIARANEQVK